uniref:EF-hand domain-containing protein n=1 Tax=Glossina pallidipes TaxID=7398 RepID=A0A1A9ZG43_GLOPL
MDLSNQYVAIGKVDLEELISAFEDLGLEVDTEEAKHLLSRMDTDGSLNISFNEWRDFLLLAPSSDIHDLIKFWRHSTRVLDLVHSNDLSISRIEPFVLLEGAFHATICISVDIELNTRNGREIVKYYKRLLTLLAFYEKGRYISFKECQIIYIITYF